MAVTPAVDSCEDAILFGPFRLIPSRRLLLESGAPVQLGSRALDLLIALAERPGEVIGKSDLIARAWPNTTIDERNLKFNISALRKKLHDGHDGSRFIVTIPGRGYCLVAPLTYPKVAEGEPPSVQNRSPHSDIPHHPLPIFGRDSAVALLASRLPAQRFVTIAGPGGIGKTTVAIAVAQKLTNVYDGGIRFFDLTPASDLSHVENRIRAHLGMSSTTNTAIQPSPAAQSGRTTLVILDNCEHLVEASAQFANSLIQDVPTVHILATSREPLRVAGEHVFRLSSLGLPDLSTTKSTAEALQFAAVELFVDRVRASLDSFAFRDEDVPTVVDICQKLDGIPLAIELAAARVEAYGVRGVSEQLDDCLRLLTHGRRASIPRHRTMRATLDWSHDHLCEIERAILRRLAVFCGLFTLDTAKAVVATNNVSIHDVIDTVAGLVAKSLLTVEVRGALQLYRMLNPTRAYAREKLFESGEFDRIAQRHADFFRELFRAMEHQWDSQEVPECPSESAHLLCDIRAALVWSFSPCKEANRFHVDTRIAARVALAREQWHKGFPDQSARMAQDCLEAASALDHPPSLAYALAVAVCPIASITGNDTAHDRGIAMLSEIAEKNDLKAFRSWANCLRGILAVNRGEWMTGRRHLESELENPPNSTAFSYHLFQIKLALAQARTGDFQRAFSTINQAIDHSDPGEIRWCVSELLRTKGKLVLLENKADAAVVAENLFRRSIDRARRQGSLSWELRASTSLARLLDEYGRATEARDLLSSVYGRFSEGFGTRDLVAAERLLHRLG